MPWEEDFDCLHLPREGRAPRQAGLQVKRQVLARRQKWAQGGRRGPAGEAASGGLVWMILWALGHRAVLSRLLPGPGSVTGRGNTGFVSDEGVVGPQHGVQQPAVKGMLQASCAPAPGVVARGGRVSPQASQASRDVGIQDIENKRRD